MPPRCSSRGSNSRLGTARRRSSPPRDRDRRDRRSGLFGEAFAADRERQPQAETCAAFAICAIQHLDAPAVGERVFARDRKSEARALDATAGGRLALIERIEDQRSFLAVDAVTLIDHLEQREAVLLRETERN